MMAPRKETTSQMTDFYETPCKNNVAVFTSLDGHFTISNVLTELFESAKKQVLISSPWMGKGFVDLARRAIPRDISISVLTKPPSENDNSVAAIDALFEVAKTLGWDVEVRCTSRLHSKFIIVDDKVCYEGSFNPTDSGIYYNLELGFTMDDPEVVRKLADFFSKMRQASVSWQQEMQFHGFEAIDRQSVQRKIAEKMMSILLDNRNVPLPKWKMCSQLKRLGFEENDIISVERGLLKQGFLYEPKTDCLALTNPEQRSRVFFLF
jgi:phosphatidylserine/phosphatidylglycerophosphate/cardiolipin synthase-like enzyme